MIIGKSYKQMIVKLHIKDLTVTLNIYILWNPVGNSMEQYNRSIMEYLFNPLL